MTWQGSLDKMETQAGETVQYTLPLGEQRLAMNPLLGQTLRLVHDGHIHCIACGRATKKSYSQGHCYPCSQRLASCDLCIMKPETCHYAAGTCREPEWGEANCMQPHFVYLANTSGLKVGITRHTQVPTRWMDQGASQALPIFRVQSRYHSGLIEQIFKAHVADRTDWRKMLKGDGDVLDLHAERDRLLLECQAELEGFRRQFGAEALQALPEAELFELHYPVLQWPQKITALNLDKTPEVGGVLQGIKGQYLLFDSGVINIRKYSGYQLRVEMCAD
ncbi:MAG: DUF2797 domain-containing protein [Chromatiales bacterium]|nr:DUF2797 domain-containing protein [Chromatiales bacterium]